jgi:hypothetical protein
VSNKTKKIDLHIHTVPTDRDSFFKFSIEKLKEYIELREIDGIAITNHNLFDLSQFEEISDAVSICVLPGVEIDVENSHILLIAENKELRDFDARCKEVSNQINTPEDSLSFSEFENIFQDFSRYILIPHYDKDPAIREDVLTRLKGFVTAGEVASPKKFKYCINDRESLVPVYFSDISIADRLSSFPTRQTYIDVSDVNFDAINICLSTGP